MQYDLSEQEARHIEKYRTLSRTDQSAVDDLLELLVKSNARIARAMAEREAAEKNKKIPACHGED